MRPVLSTLLSLSALAAASSRSLLADFDRFAPRNSAIQWQPCENDSTNATECGHFEVPLDYADQSAGKGSLAVARYPATKQPRLGTLFLNPGGPGGSGVDFIVGSGATIMDTVHGQYDLVSWDPRGVGASYPRVGCFASASEEKAFWEGTLVEGLEARGNFTDPAELKAFYAQLPKVDELLIQYGNKCMNSSLNMLQYVGSTATVRDMVALHDYLEGPDQALNYWGLSYGTIIGIYFVNMFPDRVGRVVIDGVLDPVYWANKPAYEASSKALYVESTDEALTGFVTACAAAGPTGCALASEGSTPDSLRNQLSQMIDMAYDYKKSAGASAELGSSTIRNIIFQGMYQPKDWPTLAENLLQVWDFLANKTSSSAKRSLPFQQDKRDTNSSDPESDQAIIAITCADALEAGNTITMDVFDEVIRVTRDVSPMFGPSWGQAGFMCHHWPVRAVERYDGPWNNTLANPILVIGNEADPVTPYISAKNVADALGDSAILVEQDDYGHLSLAMHSDCTMKILGNYFLHNRLPSTDQFCGTNQQLFPGPGVTKSSLAALSVSGGNSNNTDMQARLEHEKTRSHQLFIAVVVMACATGVLLILLVGSCIISRRYGNKQKDVVYWGKDDVFEEGHAYKTPYDSVPALKLGSGYAPVKT
ncbi:Abhydrolase domain-containing protein [Ceratobasidium sp. AG-Ba]|nr:Abhydrolase domain-containing protein [Ceratobasidium sp. AG-Ba]QRW06146.1 Abhydrolase domain-containing protein [Ceratobasidium sp. AG-Ba]